jgi:hypothetical protein
MSIFFNDLIKIKKHTSLLFSLKAILTVFNGLIYPLAGLTSIALSLVVFIFFYFKKIL